MRDLTNLTNTDFFFLGLVAGIVIAEVANIIIIVAGSMGRKF